MKTLITLFACLVSFSPAFAQSNTLSEVEVTKLFVGSINQLKLSNESPYDGNGKSVLDLYTQAIFGPEDSGRTPTKTEAGCKIEKGREHCHLEVNHLPFKDSGEVEEGFSYMFWFEIDRTSGKPQIKGNKVKFDVAG